MLQCKADFSIRQGLCTRLGHGSQDLPISVSWSCHLVPCSPRLGSLRSTFTYRQLLNLYSFTARGTRLPNRTPVTVYLWCLHFFAFLVAGLPAGLVAALSERNSWAARSARAASNTQCPQRKYGLRRWYTGWAEAFCTIGCLYISLPFQPGYLPKLRPHSVKRFCLLWSGHRSASKLYC